MKCDFQHAKNKHCHFSHHRHANKRKWEIFRKRGVNKYLEEGKKIPIQNDTTFDVNRLRY